MIILKKSSDFLLFVSLLIISSCDLLVYSPEEEHFVNVNQPHADLSINLSSSDDSLLVRGNSEFRYTIDIDNKIFASVVFYLNNKKIGSTTDNNSYIFNSNNFSDGNYTLRLEVWVYSESGSLADKLQSEFLISKQEWNLTISNLAPEIKTEIDTFLVSNGYLQIHWTEYPYHNFRQYEVYKARYFSSGSTLSYQLQTVIYDKHKTFWNDTVYIGGTYKYKIRVKINDGFKESLEKFYSDIGAFLYPLNILSKEKVELKWSKCKYYSAFSKYVIYVEGSNNYYEVASIYNIADTSFIDNAGFGNKIAYFLDVKEKNDLLVRSNTVSDYVGDKLQDIYEIRTFSYIPNLNSIYLNGRYRYNAHSLQFLDKCDGHIEVSRSGSFAFMNEEPENYYYDNPPHTFTLVNPVNYEKGPELVTDNLLRYYSTNENFLITEAGLIFYLGYRKTGYNTYGPPAKILINTNPPQLLFKDSTYYYSSKIFISNKTEEGEYIFEGPQLYRLQDKSLKKVYNLNTFEFVNRTVFAPSGKEFIVSENKNLNFYKCGDKSLIKSLDIGVDLFNLMIDESTGYLGGITSNTFKYVIYDLNDGHLVKEIYLSRYGGTDCFLANSFLISRTGYYIKLEY